MNNPVLTWLGKALSEYRDQDAPITYSLLGLVIGIFVAEIYFTFTHDLASIRVFATGLFGVLPYAAWPLAPVLHRGVPHFLASIGGLWVLGIPVEQELSRWRYAAFLLISGCITTVIGAGVMLLFSDGQIAYYGSSGIIYALSGFSLYYFPHWYRDVSRIESVAVLVGAIGLLFVVIDPFTGPYFTVRWVNGGHMGGFVIGLLIGSIFKKL